MKRKRTNKFKYPKSKVKLRRKDPATDKQLEFLKRHGLNFQKGAINKNKAQGLIHKIKEDIKKSGKTITLVDLAKHLNENLPKSEQWFLDQLKLRELDFKLKQNIIVGNKYIADFINQEEKIIIEIDGSIHNKNSVLTKDIHKDQFLTEIGYKVIRIKHNNIKSLEKGIQTYLKLIYKKPVELSKRDKVLKVWTKGKCGKCKKLDVKLNKFYYSDKSFYYCDECYGAYARTQK